MTFQQTEVWINRSILSQQRGSSVQTEPSTTPLGAWWRLGVVVAVALVIVANYTREAALTVVAISAIAALWAYAIGVLYRDRYEYDRFSRMCFAASSARSDWSRPHDQPIAVVLDLVHPVSPPGAGLDKAVDTKAGKHARRIAAGRPGRELSQCRGTDGASRALASDPSPAEDHWPDDRASGPLAPHTIGRLSATAHCAR